MRTLLATGGGVLTGLAYHYGIGCWTGTCWIAADPVLSGGYFGVIGFFVGGGADWLKALAAVARAG